MEREEVGIVSICQGGITYLLYQKSPKKNLRKSSEKERPHTETSPANLSLLTSLEAPSSSLLGSGSCAGTGNLCGLQLSSSGRPALAPRVPMGGVRMQLRQSGVQCCSPHTNTSGSTEQRV